MRAQMIGSVAVAFVLLQSLPGCGSNEDMDELFAAPNGGSTVDASTDGNAGGASGSGGTQGKGGTGGASNGGTGGGNAGTGGVPGTGGNGAGGTAGSSGSSGASGTAGAGGLVQPSGAIPCSGGNPFEDSNECSIPDEVCCLSFTNTWSGDCMEASQASSCNTTIACAGPEDCPSGTVCCGSLREMGPTNRYEQVNCRLDCDGDNSILFCDPNDAYQTCPNGTYCGESDILPDGYHVCRSY